ncbi:MAG: hypothetical protein H7263_16220, partial [Candidatus Sericytochromatia bacterium]|nr:hypothetical protein [Candidatus Sericytochromatia bacterium]
MCSFKIAAQTKFAYGINAGIGISKAKFQNQNTIEGLSIKKSNFVHLDISADWHMGNNFRIAVGLAFDSYKDRYKFDELEYLFYNHPDLLKAQGNTISSLYTKTNGLTVPSVSLSFQYDYKPLTKLSILPYVGFKFNYVPLYKDSLANQLNIGSSIVPDFQFNTWLTNPNEFNPSFVVGTKFRWYVSKKHLLQLGLGYEYLTKNLKQGTLRINYLGKDSRE